MTGIKSWARNVCLGFCGKNHYAKNGVNISNVGTKCSLFRTYFVVAVVALVLVLVFL